MKSINAIFQMPHFEALKALQLYIKHHIAGLMIGMHQSPKKGFGIEFKEYRNYVAGDSLKQLDWKYFARTDHYMIKEAEMEKQHEFIFVLDRSLSMTFEMEKNSKFNWSRTIISALAFLANNQYDKYTMFKQDEASLDFDSFLYRLLQMEPHAAEINDLNPQDKIKNRSTVFIFTDGYADESHFSKLLQNWALASGEVMLIHLFFENEEQLDFKGQYFTFQDLESKGSVEVNTQDALRQYKMKVVEWKRKVQKDCARYGIAYYQLTGKEGIQKSLFDIVSRFNQSWS